ncbi:MAG TPA: hypothetical protein VJU60_02645 [Thermoleophilaceae bacterium]|nr:hypothetical protein [Thermoleophilaceae bacterium]
MLLALLALALVAVVLALPTLAGLWTSRGESRAVRRRARSRHRFEPHDPGRERRAEQRARELLRSCVNEEEWAMYRDLGFIRVAGRLGQPDPATGEPAYAYLVYPHKPIVAYVPKTRRLLSEYCVEFPDLTRAISHSRLPDSDDVLAKWMALTGDEEHLIRNANMHLPGRQVDPGRVRRDLWRLAEWERQQRGSGSFEAHQT